jgi:hypothetical protein
MQNAEGQFHSVVKYISIVCYAKVGHGYHKKILAGWGDSLLFGPHTHGTTSVITNLVDINANETRGSWLSRGTAVLAVAAPLAIAHDNQINGLVDCGRIHPIYP